MPILNHLCYGQTQDWKLVNLRPLGGYCPWVDDSLSAVCFCDINQVRLETSRLGLVQRAVSDLYDSDNIKSVWR